MMMPSLLQKNKGFTLIEILVAIGVLTLILGATISLIMMLVQSRSRSQIVGEVDGQGTNIMQTLAQTIRNASSIAAPATGASASAVSLVMSDSAKSPTSFSLSGGIISMTEGSTAAVPLSSSQVTVSNLSFLNLSRPSTPGVIRIQFTVSYSTGAYAYSKNFIGAASLRQLVLK
ncbi:MAG: prepilin-type N-terminal cleavage/methylation domain-containing protein [Patescibacteria group bacterium]